LAIGGFVLGLHGDTFGILMPRDRGEGGKRAQRVIDLARVCPDWRLGNGVVGYPVGSDMLIEEIG